MLIKVLFEENRQKILGKKKIDINQRINFHMSNDDIINIRKYLEKPEVNEFIRELWNYKEKTIEQIGWEIQRKLNIELQISKSFIAGFKNGIEQTIYEILGYKGAEHHGIDKLRGHPRTMELIPDDFFWDHADDLGPFGNDDGDSALADYRDWRMDNPGVPIKDYLIEVFEYIGEMELMDYNKNILDRDLIKSHIDANPLWWTLNIFKLDLYLIGTGFGQLADEGKIDEDIKPILGLAIERLIITSELDTKFKYRDEYTSNLNILKKVLEKA